MICARCTSTVLSAMPSCRAICRLVAPSRDQGRDLALPRGERALRSRGVALHGPDQRRQQVRDVARPGLGPGPGRPASPRARATSASRATQCAVRGWSPLATKTSSASDQRAPRPGPTRSRRSATSAWPLPTQATAQASCSASKTGSASASSAAASSTPAGAQGDQREVVAGPGVTQPVAERPEGLLCERVLGRGQLQVAGGAGQVAEEGVRDRAAAYDVPGLGQPQRPAEPGRRVVELATGPGR